MSDLMTNSEKDRAFLSRLAVHFFDRLFDLAGEVQNDERKASPDRYIKAFLEMTEGNREDPDEILKTRFSTETVSMIAVRGIPFVSMCEHHFLPFSGTALVAYVPNLGPPY